MSKKQMSMNRYHYLEAGGGGVEFLAIKFCQKSTTNTIICVHNL